MEDEFQPATEFIVMSARVRMAGYARLAVVEVRRGAKPKMISLRARGVVQIARLVDRLHIGGKRSAYAYALADAKKLCAWLNDRNGEIAA